MENWPHGPVFLPVPWPAVIVAPWLGGQGSRLTSLANGQSAAGSACRFSAIYYVKGICKSLLFLRVGKKVTYVEAFAVPSG